MPTDHAFHQLPSFQSRLPESLLKDLKEPERFLYIQSDKTDQRIEWLMSHALDQAAKLEEVRQEVKETKEQAMKTNGRLLSAEKTLSEHEPAVKKVELGTKVVTSRWFWIGAAAFVFFVAPWMMVHAPSPATFLQAVFGL